MNPDKMEHPEFDAPLCFPDCPRNLDADANCSCDDIEKDMRAEFAEMFRRSF